MELLFLLSAVLGTGFSVLLGSALLTYIRRTLQVMRAERDGSIQDRMLDELDQLRIVGSLTAERLNRIETLLEEQGRRLPPAPQEATDEDTPGEEAGTEERPT